MCSHIDMQTHARQLGFDLLTSGSVHAQVLPWTICLPTLVLIAQAVFLLHRGQTDRQTRLNAHPKPVAIQPAWVTIQKSIYQLL